MTAKIAGGAAEAEEIVLDEIHLLAELMILAAHSDTRPSLAEVDEVLGVPQEVDGSAHASER